MAEENEVVDRRETIPVPTGTSGSGGSSVGNLTHKNDHVQRHYELRYESAHRQLARQLPKDDGTRGSSKSKLKEEPKFWIQGKIVSEWTEDDVLNWLKTVLDTRQSKDEKNNNSSDSNGDNISDKYGLSKDSISNYIWCFQSNHVNGSKLINEISSRDDLIKLGIDGTDSINIDILLHEINLLRAKMNMELKQYSNLHPIRKSKIEIAKYNNSNSNKSNKNNKDNDNSASIDERNELYIASLEGRKLGRYRWNGKLNLNMKLTRMKYFMANLFIFCIIILVPSFINGSDIGQGIAAIACLNGLIFASLKMKRDSLKLEEKTKEYMELENELLNNAGDSSFYTRKENIPNDVENELAKEAENIYDEFDESDPRRNTKGLPSFRFNLEHPLDIIGVFSFVISVFSFVISRFFVINSDDTEQFLYAIGISIFFIGQCVLLIWDIAYIGLFDGKRRRMLLFSFIHLILCFLNLDYYSVGHDNNNNNGNEGDNILITIFSYIAGVMDCIIFVYLILRKDKSHKETRFVISHRISYILSHIILIFYFITIITIISDYDFDFYPIHDTNVVCSVGWFLWTSIFTLLYCVDINQWLLSPAGLCGVQS